MGSPASQTLTRTACSYCGVGCGIEVRTTVDATTNAPVIARVSGDSRHPANFGRLCTKGATHAELMGTTDTRLRTAMMRARRDAEPVAAPVDHAIAEAAARLRSVIDEHGPDSVAVYVSGQMSLEAQYLATKLAKGFIRTVHMESNSRLCMASAGTGYKQSLGADGPPGSYDDFDHADLFLVIGSNMADCHPVLFLRMADRLKAGAKMIVADPRRTATAERADLFLQINPGTDLALLNGILHLLVTNDAVDEDFIAEHTHGWDAMTPFLADYPPERVATITGIPPDDIRAAAAMIAGADNWMSCWTMGLNQSTHGTWNTNAICNLHLATGAICQPGSGPFSLTGQPNAMGGREMGYMGPGLPGQRSVLSPDDRAFVEQRWGLAPNTIRADIGVGTIEMFERMAAGQIKACWIIATNPVATMPNRGNVIAGLQAADLVISQDAYLDTATSRYADIMLPATLWAESDAVNVNSERTLTLLRGSVPPCGDARPDWQLICQMAEALGYAHAFAYESSEQVFDEIVSFSNPATGYDVRGASYRRLEGGPVQWPCPPDDECDRHPIRYLNDGISQPLHVSDDGHVPRLAFPTRSRRAAFLARPHVDPAEMPDDDYPLVLNTGRLQHQWHTMTKTGTVDQLNKLNPAPFVEVHPDDADALGIVDGARAELVSRRGRAVLPAVVTDRVSAGTCFAPFHWNDEHGELLTVNAVTNDAVDPQSLQPELKVCAVALRPVGPGPEPAGHPVATTLGVYDEPLPALTEVESQYLAGFFSMLPRELAGTPVLPDSAPLREPVRARVDGMLAGAYAMTAASPTPSSGRPAGPLVVWASQTGTAEEVAERLAEQLDTAGWRSQLVSMADCRLADLAAARDVLVVTSTFGDGGPPDNGADFWSRLEAADAPTLDGVRYAVLGIGDRSYADFCGHARSIDARLADLGATPLLQRAELEAYEQEPMAKWADAVTTLIGAPVTEPARPPARKSTEPQPFSRNCPISVPLSRNIALTPPAAAKEVRQFAFDISEHGVTYSVGDSLGVYASNSDTTVSRWLAVTGLHGDGAVVVDGTEMPLREALAAHYDICRVTPGLLAFVGEHSIDTRALKQLRSNTSHFDSWLVGRNAIDLLEQFPVVADAEQWQRALVRLTPRSYSIASSPLVDPHEVHLTVSVVRYRGRDGLDRGGVCSTFLAERASGPVPIFLQHSPHFRPPEEPGTPIVMIGPGTGIAPFRGFLHERRALGDTGRNWLFFGDRHGAHNFYYRDELLEMFRDGFLSRLDLAFSRDQAERVYVQHRMAEKGAALWEWLQDGAHVYVCGDATRMAKDVDAALTRIIKTHGRLSDEQAHDYKRELVAAKRYLRDVY
ncbi:MAG: molybdopterin-dependent oxidoreductase [Candidatus Sericytochromatia bacterium]